MAIPYFLNCMNKLHIISNLDVLYGSNESHTPIKATLKVKKKKNLGIDSVRLYQKNLLQASS